eukprot:1922120-Rhodomonas_salina.1
MIPDGVLDSGKKRQLTMLVECGLRMDNDAGNVEMRTIEKEEKYHSARVVLRAGLRQEMEDNDQRVDMGREPHAAGARDPDRTTSTSTTTVG